MMSRSKCFTCGITYAPEPTSYFPTTPIIQSFCVACKDIEVNRWKTKVDEKNIEWSRKVDEKNVELEELRSRLTFLRLQLDNKPPNEIRKGDARIIVQGRTDEPIYAHKFIMSSKSGVFRKMFEIKMSEGETGIVRIDDATLPVIRAMIKFCYNAEIDFTDEVTADEVLKVAHKYEIGLLHQICEKYLIKTLTNANLPKRLRLAKKFDAGGLEVAASHYFKAHFDSVISDVLMELC